MTAGSTTRLAATETATQIDVAIPIIVSNPMPQTASPEIEMTTVRPAARTDRPAEAVASATASLTSRP